MNRPPLHEHFKLETCEPPAGYVALVWGSDPGLSLSRAKSHVFAIDGEGAFRPMCPYGWNRNAGQSVEIDLLWTQGGPMCARCRDAVVERAEPCAPKGRRVRRKKLP